MQPHFHNLTMGNRNPSHTTASPHGTSFPLSDMRYVTQMSSSPMECKLDTLSDTNVFCPTSSGELFDGTDKRNSYQYNHPVIYTDHYYNQQISSPVYNIRQEQRYSKCLNVGNKNYSPQYEDVFPRYSNHSSRASSSTVAWLLDNYETADGVSLPRCTLYYHYKAHCHEMHLPQMNQASFGKLIRSVFIGLRTRRLGTRGNSKYHYYGIRVKPTSKLNRMEEIVPTKRTYRILSQPEKNKVFPKQVILCTSANEIPYLSARNDIPRKQTNVSQEIPPFKPIEKVKTTKLRENVITFQTTYRHHCNEIKQVLLQFNFKLIPTIWKDFWGNFNNKMSSEQFHETVSCDEVVVHVFQADCVLYQHIVALFVPDVLQETNSQIQNIRSFAKTLEAQLDSVLAQTKLTDQLISYKLDAVAAFAQKLRRHTKLQHLAQATRGVLEDHNQLRVMSADISKIDLIEIQEQMVWLSRCKNDFVQQIQDKFLLALSQFTNIEQWAAWLEDIVDVILAPHSTSSSFQEAAQQLLLKWSAYMSAIIRDLTLRSCNTFGAFHLMRLFFDDYMHYLVENKVAAFLQITVIGLIAENRRNTKQCRNMDNPRVDESRQIVEM